MPDEQMQEYWLRGPVPGIPLLLQPVAHAILQSRWEVNEALKNFPDELLCERPAGVASVGFHLLHMAGVLDRLFTYARGQSLSPQQLDYLGLERNDSAGKSRDELLTVLGQQVEKSIVELGGLTESSLLEERWVGRKKIPSNVLGLLFHAAEHMQRHTGQLIVTTRILYGKK